MKVVINSEATDGIVLTEEQQKQILKREKAFADGKTTARAWDEIKQDLDNLYR